MAIFCQFAIFVVACISGHKRKNNENNIKGATGSNTSKYNKSLKETRIKGFTNVTKIP